MGGNLDRPGLNKLRQAIQRKERRRLGCRAPLLLLTPDGLPAVSTTVE